MREEFKGIPTEKIREILDQRRRNFATLVVNIEYELNMATIMRTHNAFCGKEFFYLGRKKYYRPGTVGVHHYEHLTHCKTLKQALKAVPDHYTWVGLDNIEGAVPIQNFDWPENPLLIFGSEKKGLDSIPDLRYHCSHIVEIPQLGSVQSLNVAAAAAITMYDLCLQQGWFHQKAFEKRW